MRRLASIAVIAAIACGVGASVSYSAPKASKQETRAASRAAMQAKREACRTQATGRGISDRREVSDFVTVCVLEARLACIKQAIDQKTRGAARRTMVNACLTKA
jgi:hypothetical protein